VQGLRRGAADDLALSDIVQNLEAIIMATAG
jgi:hypothetical protein